MQLLFFTLSHFLVDNLLDELLCDRIAVWEHTGCIRRHLVRVICIEESACLQYEVSRQGAGRAAVDENDYWHVHICFDYLNAIHIIDELYEKD